MFGQYDAKLDTPALQARALRTQVSEKLGQAIPPGSEPAPIALGDADSQLALEALYDERFGAAARAAKTQGRT